MITPSMRPAPIMLLVSACLLAPAPTTGIAQEGVRFAPTVPASPTPTPTSPVRGAPANSLPTYLDDPAFNGQVDIFLLGKAWQRHDAALMTDVGLLLAHCERTLMRHHKAIEASRVLELAAYIAADRKDEATLKRLDAIASKDEKLRTMIAAARQTAEKANPGDHPISDSMEELTPEGLAVHQAALRQIRMARLSGDIDAIEALDKHLDTRDDLHSAQQGHLDKVIAKAKTAMNKDNEGLRATIRTLDRIAAMGPSYRNTRSPY